MWMRLKLLIPFYTEAGPINVLKGCLPLWPWVSTSPQRTYELCNYHTRDTVDRLVKNRINFVTAGWSVGLSIEAEKIQREQVRTFTAACHRRSLKVCFYISWNGLFWRSMFEDVPQSREWLRLDADGSPIRDFMISERYMGCVNNPGWWRYLKKKVALAVHAGADAIFFDNCDSSCYCRHCRRRFRQYARKHFGHATALERTKAQWTREWLDRTLLGAGETDSAKKRHYGMID